MLTRLKYMDACAKLMSTSFTNIRYLPRTKRKQTMRVSKVFPVVTEVSIFTVEGVCLHPETRHATIKWDSADDPLSRIDYAFYVLPGAYAAIPILHQEASNSGWLAPLDQHFVIILSSRFKTFERASNAGDSIHLLSTPSLFVRPSISLSFLLLY